MRASSISLENADLEHGTHQSQYAHLGLGCVQGHRGPANMGTHNAQTTPFELPLTNPANINTNEGSSVCSLCQVHWTARKDGAVRRARGKTSSAAQSRYEFFPRLGSKQVHGPQYEHLPPSPTCVGWRDNVLVSLVRSKSPK